MGGFFKDGSVVYIYVDNGKKSTDVKVYPADEETGWNDTFERFAYNLKKDVERILAK
jgi:hypothetical protein